MYKRRVLVVDDQQLHRWAMKEKITAWGYEVLDAADAHTAVDLFAAELPDVVLLDLRLGADSGLDVLRQIKAIDPTAAVIMITGHGALNDAVNGFRLGLQDFLSKPVDFDALRMALNHRVEARTLRDEVQRWRHSDQGDSSIIGNAPALRAALETLKKVAASGATTVLLQGESGTGKDLFAKAIHYASARADGPFIAVNCAALPDALLESELFGHERGAFTDARSAKKGLFETADGGTLYLDEIGELKPPMQAKLLRAVETLTFRRVGGVRDVTVDLRVIAASNRPLERAVDAGEFRPDLYYRLSVIQLRLPPLRERREDVALLADHFVREFNAKLRKAMRGISPDAMRLLVEHPWRGNVRELKNAIEHAMILEESDWITPAHLTSGLSAGASAGSAPLITLPPTGLSLEAVESALVSQAMTIAGGNQSRAARLLDIGRDALRYKLKKYGIAPGDDAGDDAAASFGSGSCAI